ncbi:MAG: CDP-alcohol phosphatidyltransferase family protein [Myxococcales bacterium]|nr:CDP-alcohol phosphatidyltransferase family protein [Myxococcales bacterium]
MTPPALPPFASLLKSRDVEDPINLWVHRPLAYALVAAVYRTPVTPNQITLLSGLCGLIAGTLWIFAAETIGSEDSLLALRLGGVFLWLSAIVDGADGILARAKSLQSDFGRAIDGAMDAIVAIATIFPGGYYIYREAGEPWVIGLCFAALLITLPDIVLYDFYKESFLRVTRPGRGGEGEDPASVEAKYEALIRAGGAWTTRWAVRFGLLPLLRAQQDYVRWTNPQALGRLRELVGTETSAQIYRKHNRTAMRLWSFLSLAPHCYLFAITAILGHPIVYVWIRLLVMGPLLMVTLVMQRRATRATLKELEEVGVLGGVPDPAPLGAEG